MLAECYRFRAFCLTVDDHAGRILAGLPVAEVHRRGRPRWVSLPFTDECPPLITPGADGEPTEWLDSLRRAFGVCRFEVRAALRGERVQRGDTYLNHRLPLDRAEDDVFAALHPNQVRRNIRRAQRAGVVVRVGSVEADLTEVFYRLHMRTRHRLGVPVQPLRYFRLLWRRFLEPGLGAVIIAELGGVPAAAGVFLAFGETCVYKYGASDERHLGARPNHLLFWESIRWAMARGCRTFDFGRTDLADTGLREFKSRWGTVEREFNYSVLADVPARAGMGAVPAPLRSAIRRGPIFVPRLLGELLYRHTA
ncbi:GNAT family N-acetyltransferase [Planosporangium thailandense]|uniref:GNAT family N-acetyltransferase n=1 Tax=Planosporangium thailandense TaxID=765197 RepID=A0ABX0XZE7_9ACTN|nr:GNAT family N-acetyltransferase [Planosporangium thailandense]NJC71272.1 GNAT family N-acetyltransferase [Planosporangium thailandense]